MPVSAPVPVSALAWASATAAAIACPMSPATAGTRSNRSSGPLPHAYSETSQPLARPMDTLFASTSTAVTSAILIRWKTGPIRIRSRPASVSSVTDAPNAAMPRPHTPSSTATGTASHSGKNTSATATPAAAVTTDLTRSTTGHRQRWMGMRKLCRMPPTCADSKQSTPARSVAA